MALPSMRGKAPAPVASFLSEAGDAAISFARPGPRPANRMSPGQPTGPKGAAYSLTNVKHPAQTRETAMPVESEVIERGVRR